MYWIIFIAVIAVLGYIMFKPKKVVVEENKVLPKTSWDDVSIRDYYTILDITKREYDSELEKEIAVAAILYGIPEEEMYGYDITQLKQLLSQIEFVQQPLQFKKNWNLKKITINGKKYTITQSVNELSVAAFCDFQNYWDKKEENMGKIMACFIVPEGHKYNEGYDVIQFSDELERTLSITFWNEFAFFLFARNYVSSIRASLRYSIWQMTKLIWKTRDRLKKAEMKAMRRQMMEKLRCIHY